MIESAVTFILIMVGVLLIVFGVIGAVKLCMKWGSWFK